MGDMYLMPSLRVLMESDSGKTLQMQLIAESFSLFQEEPDADKMHER